MVISHDDTKIVSIGGDKTVVIWDTTIGVINRKLQGHTSKVTSMAISHDGKEFVSGGGDKTVIF